MNTLTLNELPDAIQKTNEATNQAIVRLQRIEELLQNHLNSKETNQNNNFTLPEAAIYCRMPIPTFRLHLSKRNVSGSKPGKKWIFSQEDLDKFLRKFHHKTKDETRLDVDQTINSRKRRISHETTI